MEPVDDVITDAKYIVFESTLIDLLNVCSECGAEASVTRKFKKGTLIVLESVCKTNVNHRRVWQNQPSHRGLPTGNLLLAGAILFSGSSPVKAMNMLKCLKIGTFCLRTYYRIQKGYLLPAIDTVWSAEQHDIMAKVTEPLKLGGDARCCSPGHTAKYGSYTLMDLKTSKVVDMQLVQVCKRWVPIWIQEKFNTRIEANGVLF